MTHNCKLISTATVICCDSVLLVKYSGMPDHQQGWFMPHDLMNELEHPRDAALRALREQLNIEIDPTKLPLKEIESFRGRDKTWHLSFHHLTELSSKIEPPPNSAIAAARWFKRSELPPREEVSHHGWALDVLESVTTAG